MVAYRAGRVPRYYVNCPVTFRAPPLDRPLQRNLSPSSIGWRTPPFWRRTSRSTSP